MEQTQLLDPKFADEYFETNKKNIRLLSDEELLEELLNNQYSVDIHQFDYQKILRAEILERMAWKKDVEEERPLTYEEWVKSLP